MPRRDEGRRSETLRHSGDLRRAAATRLSYDARPPHQGGRDGQRLITKGATHMDLYAGDHAGQALQKLAPFYKQKL
jgi:hypothetical protein